MKSLIRLALFLLAAAPVVGMASEPWKSSVSNTRHSLAYTAKVPLLGVTTPVTVVFGCDPMSDKESSGTLGLDITVRNTGKLKTFPFGDFEGPDATVAPKVEVVVNRKDKPPLTFRTTASGSYSEEDVFCFNVSDLSKKAKSVPRSLLQALADNEATSVRVTIADPRNSQASLEINVPVGGKQGDFQTLLTGLK